MFFELQIQFTLDLQIVEVNIWLFSFILCIEKLIGSNNKRVFVMNCFENWQKSTIYMINTSSKITASTLDVFCTQKCWSNLGVLNLSARSREGYILMLFSWISICGMGRISQALEVFKVFDYFLKVFGFIFFQFIFAFLSVCG